MIVVVECEHLCMSMRGVRKPGSRTVTSAVRGQLRDAATRAEAMSLIHGPLSAVPARGVGLRSRPCRRLPTLAPRARACRDAARWRRRRCLVWAWST